MGAGLVVLVSLSGCWVWLGPRRNGSHASSLLKIIGGTVRGTAGCELPVLFNWLCSVPVALRSLCADRENGPGLGSGNRPSGHSWLLK
jgi:hypothetical protein